MIDEHARASAIIRLMQGVVYRESDEDSWLTLERAGAGVRDHFATIGVDVVFDETEGYAYLRSRPEIEGDRALPRLVRRRALTYHLSLLLVLLRKRLVEFETGGGEGRLVLTTAAMVEMLRLFQADSTNDARLSDQAERSIAKAAELGFLRQLRGERDHWEVRRILKAYVDAETLSDFATKLRQYAGPGSAGPGSAGPGNAGPGSAGPGSAGPGSAGPGSAGPGNAGPESAGPGSAGSWEAGEVR